ncbi:MAG: hypothetical protein KatS3mg010_1181 [Acidimicrobiia bacterium]|nr:MAG: hypothetical protein KatS3mg010_1181 [Acidimicrobiia bacterium]
MRQVGHVDRRRLLAAQHLLGADHVGDVVLHGPARQVRGPVPLGLVEVAAQREDVAPHLLEQPDHRFFHSAHNSHI